MGLTRGSGQRSSRNAGLAPYYERLEPLDGGYEITRESAVDDDGMVEVRVVGRIRVFDDREEGGTGIHVQFSQGRGKTAVFHLEDETGIDDCLQALAAAKIALG
jgi:hypothetical protein